eukprot:PhF_6_TR38927/c0_g1_i1/m.58236/K18752/TNPO1, IPO2, KPNB2; transportin-1
MSSLSSFQPNSELLQQLCLLLHTAANPQSSNPTAARQALDQLDANASQPQFHAYLSYIFLRLEAPNPNDAESIADTEKLRLYGGYMLKKNIRIGLCNPQDGAVQECVLMSLGDPANSIRRCGSSLVTTLVEIGGIGAWMSNDRNLFAILSEGLCVEEPCPRIDGILRTIAKICEDHVDLLSDERLGYPASYMLPAVTRWVRGGLDALPLTHLALDAVVAMLEAASADDDSATFAIVREKAEEIFSRVILQLVAGDNGAAEQAVMQHGELQKNVCRVCVHLLLYDSPALRQHAKNLTHYMLRVLVTSRDRHAYDIALEACEFWAVLTEESAHVEALSHALNEILPELIPVLVSSLVYTDEELGMIMAEPDDCRVPDAGHKARRGGGGGGSSGGA